MRLQIAAGRTNRNCRAIRLPPMSLLANRSVPGIPLRFAAFTLVEMLVAIALIAILAALSVPAFSGMRESSRTAQNLARMKTVATALITGAGENRGFVPSFHSASGRWPVRAHRYFGIRPDLDAASSSAHAAQDRESAYVAEVMRPVQLDPMRKAILDGSKASSPQGIWLVNRHLVWNGTAYNPAQQPMSLLSVTSPSKTPLVCMPSENNGLGTFGEKIHPSAKAHGFKDKTDNTGPAPLGNGKMLYGMCDGSVQTLPDFWPFQDPEWPEPWKAFHPLGKDAPAGDAP